MKKLNKAFTLVELIVVITILVILGTIAFLSYQGYSKTARDSKRISDIGNLKTSLGLFQLKVGKYPTPDFPENVTFSGAEVWSQGVISEGVFTNLSNINKKPIDPLTDSEYTYSLLNTKKEFQIGGILEGGKTSYINISNETYAAGTITAQAYITGDYNGETAVVSTGSLTYVLAVPSIISSEVGDIKAIIENGGLAYDGFSNLPSSYSGTSVNVNGTPGLNLTNQLVVYSGTLTNLTNQIDQKILVTNLQTAYTGTQISNVAEINTILTVNPNDTTAVNNLVADMTNNNNGGLPSLSLKSSAAQLGPLNGGPIDISCTGLIGVVSGFPAFDLCTNTVELTYNTPIVSSLTAGKRDVYGIYLEAKTYKIQIPYISAFTMAYLYSDNGTQVAYKSAFTTEFTYSVTTPGVYYIGVLGYNDNSVGNYSITATEHIINGQCGTDNSYNIYYTPTNLCISGTPSGVTDNGLGFTYNWSCNGNPGTNASCSANHILDPRTSPILGCTSTSTGQILSLGSTYPGCDKSDIAVCTGNNDLGIIISACNVGTNVSGTGTNSYGGLFQWGNNADFRGGQFTLGNIYPTTSSTLIGTTTNDSTYTNANFIVTSGQNWTSIQNDNLWGDHLGLGDEIQRKGPCGVGYHVPLQSEFSILHTAGQWGTNGRKMMNDLLLPLAGLRGSGDASLQRTGTSGTYLSTTPFTSMGVNVRALRLTTNNINSASSTFPSIGNSIRCFKN